MGSHFHVVSPADGSVFVERPLASPAEIARTLAAARRAAPRWKGVPLDERARLVSAAVDAFVARRDAVAEEIARQMGRPIAQCPGEIRGFEERARYMISIASRALADVDAGPKMGFRR